MHPDLIGGIDMKEVTVEGEQEPLTKELVTLREYLETKIDEVEQRSFMRYNEVRATGEAALTAQKEQVRIAFEASQVAIKKSENSQREYNLHTNDFRAQLDSQTNSMIPRTEANAIIRVLEDRIEVNRGTFDKGHDEHSAALAEFRLLIAKCLTLDEYNLRHAEMQRQISDLKDFRSATTGIRSDRRDIIGYVIGIGGLVVAIASVILVLVLH